MPARRDWSGFRRIRTASSNCTHAPSPTARLPQKRLRSSSIIVQHAVAITTSLIVRELRGVPEACPDCGSPNLTPEQGENSAAPGVLWKRPRCTDCGWAGRPIPIVGVDTGKAIITREGKGTDDHSYMTAPPTSIRKPGDPPIAPLAHLETNPPEPTEYFAYGSNMATARIRERMPSAEPLGVATLQGHELRFHKRSKKDKSAKCDAFATGDDESACLGVLFKFDSADRADLDRAEGAGKGYEAKMVMVINSQGR